MHVTVSPNLVNGIIHLIFNGETFCNGEMRKYVGPKLRNSNLVNATIYSLYSVNGNFSEMGI